MLNFQVRSIENAIQDCALVFSYTLHKEQLSPNTGYIDGEIFFTNSYRLSFFEFHCLIENNIERDKYKYHLMDGDNSLIFRYDNAPHHNNISSYPHHKHLPHEIVSSKPMDFSELIEEIEQVILNEM